VICDLCLFPDSAHRVSLSSIVDGHIALGRSLRRTVDLFHSVRDLVEEGERRSRLEEDGLDVDSSEE
jgi:hypothetical protein